MKAGVKNLYSGAPVKPLLFLGALVAVAGMSAMLMCSDIANPYQDPANAHVIPESSLVNLGDSLRINDQHVSAVRMYLPALMERYDAYLVTDAGTVLADSGAVEGDSVLVRFVPDASGAHTLKVIITKTDGVRDSVQQEFVAYSARIDRGRSLAGVRDTMTLRTGYRCSVFVKDADLAMRYEAHLFAGDTSKFLDSGAVQAQNEIAYTTFGVGDHRIRVTVEARDGFQDTLEKTFVLTSWNPVVYPDTLVRVHNLDSVEAVFNIMDFDTNLIGASLHINPPDTVVDHPVLATRSFADTIRYVFRANNHDTVIITARAIDKFSLEGFARCTLVVYDTVAPAITLLEPETNTRIFTLPVDLRARIQETGKIDSAVFYRADGSQRHQMAYSAGEAAFQISQLDSGVYEYRIAAWDRYGNVDSVSFDLDYGGDRTYPPAIAGSLDRVTQEGVAFDTLHLNAAVITHPDSPYTRAELAWGYELVDDDTALHVHIVDDSLGVVFLADSADSEWAGTQVVQFTVRDPLGFSSAKLATFTITPVNDTPRVLLTKQFAAAGGLTRSDRTWFDTLWLDTCVYDPDDSPDSLRWRIDAGDYLEALPVTTFGCGGGFKPLPGQLPKSAACLIRDSTRMVIREINSADSLWTGTDSLTIIVEDPQGAVSSQKIQYSRYLLIGDPVLPQPGL